MQEQIKIRQSKCPLTGKWVDCVIHIIYYYVVIKINELWLHSSTWIDFKVFERESMEEYIEHESTDKIQTEAKQCKTTNTNEATMNR